MDVTPNHSQHQIKNSDVLLTYIGRLTMGKPAFESVHEFSYKTAEVEEKTVTVRTEYEVINRTIDEYGQFLLEGDIEAHTWWTNLGLTDHEVIGLYHAHGECEQIHSEIKTDMDLERLPPGKFETNELVLEIGNPGL